MQTLNERALRPSISRVVAAVAIAIAISPSLCRADSGKPVALRSWGESCISIETYWDLRVILCEHDDLGKLPGTSLSADVVCSIGNVVAQVDSRIEETMAHEWRINAASVASTTTFVLDRFPNTEQATWQAADPQVAESGHAVRVTAVPLSARENERQHAVIVDVDGVRVLYVSAQILASTAEIAPLKKFAVPVDVLVVKLDGTASFDWEQVVEQFHPRRIVSLSDKGLEQRGPVVAALQTQVGASRVDQVEHGNTVALCAAKNTAGDATPQPPVVTLLGTSPWELPPNWESLFARMDRASQATEDVFRPLTVQQLNFRPANGTHTPRWNAEHMMGRQLGFFTQIYHQLDPSIPHLDLNPQQNPPDYVAAHPDWTGAEEARQIARTRALTRRFSYLLAGLDLEQKAPGSFWTPLGLLVQMERHYDEHTENVKKKFDLPDWPQ